MLTFFQQRVAGGRMSSFIVIAARRMAMQQKGGEEIIISSRFLYGQWNERGCFKCVATPFYLNYRTIFFCIECLLTGWMNLGAMECLE